MAKIPFQSIGSARDDFLRETSYQLNTSASADRVDLLEERRAEVHAGWGEKYVERVHAKGKLTARERIAP